MSAADSGYVGTYAQWLSTGDEDLNDLRATDEFVDFLDRYLPNEELRVVRPRKLLQLVMSLHALQLLQRYARLRADFWEAQDGTAADHAAAVAEFDQEQRVRRIVHDYADNDRYWHCRLALIEEARSFVLRRGLPPFSSALPFFQDDPTIKDFGKDHRAAPGDTDPDGYYEAVVKKRDAVWGVVGGIVDPDAAGSARNVQWNGSGFAVLASVRSLWIKLDETLTEELYGPAMVKQRAARRAYLASLPSLSGMSAGTLP